MFSHSGKDLLLLAIIPPDDLRDQLEVIRQDFATKYDCKAALKPPIHITLIPPFYLAGEHVPPLSNLIAEIAKDEESFAITISNYGTFPKNHVIFINVETTPPLLHIQTRIEHSLSDQGLIRCKTSQPYHPHI